MTALEPLDELAGRVLERGTATTLEAGRELRPPARLELRRHRPRRDRDGVRSRRPSLVLAPAPWVVSAEADGCLCTSVEDLATFLRALWRGSAPLSAESLAAMTTPFRDALLPRLPGP
jgi:hypothetical protein